MHGAEGAIVGEAASLDLGPFEQGAAGRDGGRVGDDGFFGPSDPDVDVGEQEGGEVIAWGAEDGAAVRGAHGAAGRPGDGLRGGLVEGAKPVVGDNPAVGDVNGFAEGPAGPLAL